MEGASIEDHKMGGDDSSQGGGEHNRSLEDSQVVDMNQFLSSKKEYTESLLEMINTIFHQSADVNVQKVGLIYLAKILRFFPQPCERYLEVLLVIHDDIMRTILSTEETDIESYIVLSKQPKSDCIGTTSFKYFRTGAPLTWNSAGLASALDSYV